MKIKKLPIKTYALVIIMFFLQMSLTAQTLSQEAPISGVIQDADHKPMRDVVVSLIDVETAKVVKTSITDSTGLYHFLAIKFAKYIISGNKLGFDKSDSKSFQYNEQYNKIVVEPLVLVPRSIELKAVQIVAKKELIERKIDRLVMNIEGSPLAEGNSALELLEKAPGIIVRGDNIEMRGKTGVRVSVDGKSSYLTGGDLTTFLRSIPSSQIESLELITNPSAKYDAAGTSGIINIKFKRDKKLGFNGSLRTSLGYGRTSKYTTGTNLNYRRKKLNIFGSYDYSNNGELSTLSLNRIVRYEDTVTNFNQQGRIGGRTDNHSFRMGTDLFLKSNTTIGFMFNGYLRQTDKNSITNSFKSNNVFQSELIDVVGTDDNGSDNISYNLNYKSIFNSKREEVTIDMNYSTLDRSNANIFNSAYSRVNLTPKSEVGILNSSTSRIDVKSFKVDYSNSVSKVGKFEMGGKYSIIGTDNNLVFARSIGEKWVPDNMFSSLFKYKESISALYLNFSKQMKRFGIQAGLRSEYTISNGKSATNETIVKRDYLNLFPSLFLLHDLGKSHKLALSYSYRIDRPNYNNLNPFLNFVDEYTYNRGNPALKPQFTHSLEISETYNGKFTASLATMRTSDIIAPITQQDNVTQRTVVSQDNVDSHGIINLSLSAPITIAKWWTSYNNASFGYVSIKSNLNGSQLNRNQYVGSASMNNSFTLSKTFNVQSSLQYNSPGVFGLFKMKSVTVFSLGCRKTYLDKFSLGLNINDVFNSRVDRVSVDYQSIDLNFRQQAETRVARFSVSYNFGKKTVAGSRKREPGIVDEVNRMRD